MQLWEQNEWHGIARYGVEKKDPQSSQIEFNTRPGEDRLERSRSRYRSITLPKPAIQFNDYGTHLRLHYYDTGEATGRINRDCSKDMTSAICFMHPDLNEFDAAAQPVIMSVGYGPNTTNWSWGWYLSYSAGQWALNFQIRRDPTTYATLFTSGALSSGVWYWAQIKVDVDGSYVAYIYASGGTTEESTGAGSTPSISAFTPTGICNIGGYGDSKHFFTRGCVAYACVIEAAVNLTPWEVKYGGYGLPPAATDEKPVFFLPGQGRRQTYPAWLDPAASQNYFWRLYPCPSLRTAALPGTSYLTCAGLYHSAACPGMIYESPTEKPFTQKTVFLFYFYLNNDDGCTLFLSEDSTFNVVVTSTGTVTVYWNPTSIGLGSIQFGQMLRIGCTTALTATANNWLAVEIDPVSTGLSPNVRPFRYNSASAVWEDLATNAAAFGASVGAGIMPLETNRFLMGHTFTGPMGLGDFREVVGDDDWMAHHTPTAMYSSMSDTLVSWFNVSTALSLQPRVDNVKVYQLSQVESGGFQYFAANDRVDGVPRYFLNTHMATVSWHGCQYLIGGMLARIEDLGQVGVNNIRGMTDFFSFDNGVVTPAIHTYGRERAQIAAVGAHRYVVGNTPLSRTAKRPARVGFRIPWVQGLALSSNVDLATDDYGGDLTYATAYTWKCTLYDPVTGSESNPFGPFRFTTDVDPAAPPGIGNACAFTVVSWIYTDSALHGMRMRFYRYHSGNGEYYLEGDGPIAFYGRSAANFGWIFTSRFTYAKSDAILSLGKAIELDNDAPPWHTVSYIWNSRAFFADALSPSRFYVSKERQYGAVPRENYFWTDEGIGGNILGFLPGFNGLLVLRENSIWMMPTFRDLSEAFVTQLIPDAGVVSGRAAVFADGVLYWASQLGLHTFDGQQVINHSKRLNGLDQKIFRRSRNKSALVAYHDQANFCVTFVCEGAGLRMDTRTGAVSFQSAPELTCTRESYDTYSGPVYGHSGALFRETTGNKSLALSSSLGMSGISTTSTAAHASITHVWTDWNGSNVTEVYGYAGAPFTTIPGRVFSSANSVNGRVLTCNPGNWWDAWGLTMHDIVSAYGVIMPCTRSLSGTTYIDELPMFYRSQDMFLGRMKDARTYERLDFVTGDTDGTCTASFALYSKVSHDAAWMSVTGSSAILPESVYQLPGRIRGQQAYYEIWTSDVQDMPEVLAVGVHFRETEPRGRAT